MTRLAAWFSSRAACSLDWLRARAWWAAHVKPRSSPSSTPHAISSPSAGWPSGDQGGFRNMPSTITASAEARAAAGRPSRRW